MKETSNRLHALHPYPQSQVVSLDMVNVFPGSLCEGTAEGSSPKTRQACVSVPATSWIWVPVKQQTSLDSKFYDEPSISLRKKPLSAITCNFFLVLTQLMPSCAVSSARIFFPSSATKSLNLICSGKSKAEKEPDSCCKKSQDSSFSHHRALHLPVHQGQILALPLSSF